MIEIEIILVILGTIIYQSSFFLVFRNDERKVWLGMTVASEAYIFGLLFDVYFWILYPVFGFGFIMAFYTISKKSFLPKNINKILYFYPTLPKIKFSYWATK